MGRFVRPGWERRHLLPRWRFACRHSERDWSRGASRLTPCPQTPRGVFRSSRTILPVESGHKKEPSRAPEGTRDGGGYQSRECELAYQRDRCDRQQLLGRNSLRLAGRVGRVDLTIFPSRKCSMTAAISAPGLPIGSESGAKPNAGAGVSPSFPPLERQAILSRCFFDEDLVAPAATQLFPTMTAGAHRRC